MPLINHFKKCHLLEFPHITMAWPVPAFFMNDGKVMKGKKQAKMAGGVHR